MPTLSALDVSEPVTTAQTQPSATVAQRAPPPIETTTPDSSTAQPSPWAVAAAPSAASPPPAQLPATRPTEQAASGWSQLLGGSAQTSSHPGPIVTGNGPLADGRASIAAGQFIDARAVLNGALQSGKLSEADQETARSLISDINQTLIFSPRAFAADPYGGAYSVRSGDSLARIAAAHQTTWELLARINRLDPRRLRAGATIKIIRGPFFAVVRKKSFVMDIYMGALAGEPGAMYVMSLPVGLGKDDSTPTGLWAIEAHSKLRHPTYYPPEGGAPIEADDPNNPLGGYWIGLTGVEGQAVGQASYGIHGTIDPNSIGHQASMGCIRLKASDIALVFDLLVEGKSKVLVE